MNVKKKAKKPTTVTITFKPAKRPYLNYDKLAAEYMMKRLNRRERASQAERIVAKIRELTRNIEADTKGSNIMTPEMDSAILDGIFDIFADEGCKLEVR